MGRKLIDLTGKKFNKLYVIERAPNRGAATMYRCKCDCGKILEIQSVNLKNGQISCGCHMKEIRTSKEFSDKKIKHGYYKHELYGSWSAMKNRCNNPKHESYRHYGGRGIKVCDEWNGDSPEQYIKDVESKLGKRPKGYTLDRIDNDGDYEIDNVRWASKSEQAVNQRHKKGKLKEKYIIYRRGLYLVSIFRDKKGMVSNGQKELKDAVFLRDYYLKVYNETPHKWEEMCNDKKYKNIIGEMIDGK